jgi:hypothetical protein
MGRRYFGGNSGYVGYSKSVRAVNAEERGLRSKSQIDKNFLEEVNALLPKENQVTLKQIKDNLKFINADEWHHTSMYGNKTDYYSAENIAEYFRPESEEEIKEREEYEKGKQEEREKREKQEKEILALIPHEPIKFHIQEFEYECLAYKSSNGLYVEIFKNLLDKPKDYSYYHVLYDGIRYTAEDVYWSNDEDMQRKYEEATKEYIDVLTKAQEKVLSGNLSLQKSIFGILMF